MKELWEAVYHKNHRAIQELLAEVPSLIREAQEVLDQQYGMYHYTALHIATKNKDIFTMRLLLGAHASVDCININGTTPLHLAVEMDDVKVARELLKAGADVKKRNYTTKSALEMAKDLKNQTIYQMHLLKATILIQSLYRGYSVRKQLVWNVRVLYQSIVEELDILSRPSIKYPYPDTLCRPCSSLPQETQQFSSPSTCEKEQILEELNWTKQTLRNRLQYLHQQHQK